MTPAVEELVRVADSIAGREEVPSLMRAQLTAAVELARYEDQQDADPIARGFSRFVARCREREGF